MMQQSGGFGAGASNAETGIETADSDSDDNDDGPPPLEDPEPSA